MFTTAFKPATAADIHSFQWTANGAIDYTVVPGVPNHYLPVSEKQWRAVSGLAFSSANRTKYFDVYVMDYVFRPGRIAGGRHTGEPLNLDALNTPTAFNTGILSTNTLKSSKLFATFPVGPGSGALRNSYKEKNLAVVIHLNLRPKPVLPPLVP
jgi:hypothetical protein